MREWLSAREIAEEQLPDMPGSERGVQKLAASENWDLNPALARPRAGRGGGMEYHYRLLPLLAQVAYQQRHMTVSRPDEPEALPAPATGGLTDRAAVERDARLAIVAAYITFGRGLQLGETAKLQVFTDKFNAGRIQVDDWVRQAVPTVSKRSLLRWKSARKEGRTDRLAFDRAASRKGTGVIDTANGGRLRAFVLALIAHQPHLTAQHVRTQCRAEFGDTIEVASKGVSKALPMPPVRTFQAALKALKAENKVALTKLTNPDHYRSTMAPSGVGTLRHVTEPNTLWQIDASPVDALCTDGRHSIYCCIDIGTRRMVWQLSRTPRASAVALMIRKSILAWGVPETIKTDNGSDFVAKDTRRLFASLAIEMELSDAFSPEQKGHVERGIRTFQHDFGPLLPGFIGHSVADRKAIESRKSFAARLGESDAETFAVSMTAAELQGWIDRWAATIYEQREHAGLGKRKPADVARESTRPIRTVDARALDLLLMPVAGSEGRRRVTKFGVRIDGRHYMTPEILPGTDVLVRMDPLDLGRIYAFSPDAGAFLGEGVCPELSGLAPETVVRAAKEIQGEMLAERTRQIKADMKRIAAGPALIERALEVAARDMPNVIPLPKRKEEHSTPQIAAALAAMSDRRHEADTGISPQAAAEQARMIEEMSGADIADLYQRTDRLFDEKIAAIAERERTPVPEGVAKLPESPKQRYRRAMKMRDAQELGQIDGDFYDGLWLARYEQSAEFKAQAAMHEDFGDAYLAP